VRLFSRRSLLILFLVVPAALALTHAVWLSALGSFLVRSDEPVKADYAVVLAGDPEGRRILAAAELVKRGLVRQAIVDGPRGSYGNWECDLAVAFAERKGYPASYFHKLPMEATSTRVEAQFAVAELRKLGARSFLLVTSNFHTRRAGRIFERAADGLDMRVISASDKHFTPDSWWRHREGMKTFYMEWSKTVAEWIGL
jgi:uncharacterized SAM-binding protein YcdF (DUF218 family)